MGPFEFRRDGEFAPRPRHFRRNAVRALAVAALCIAGILLWVLVSLVGWRGVTLLGLVMLGVTLSRHEEDAAPASPKQRNSNSRRYR